MNSPPSFLELLSKLWRMDVVLQDFDRAIIGLIDMYESSWHNVLDRSIVVGERGIGVHFVLCFFSGVISEDVREYLDSCCASTDG